MSAEESLTPAERELEAALGGLAPARPAIDRDVLMFRAGHANAGRSGLLWKAATAALAASLAMVLLLRGDPEPTVRVVYLHGPAVEKPVLASDQDGPAAAVPPAATVNLPAGSYVKLCNDMVDHGVDVLDAAASSSRSTPPLTLRNSLGRSRPTGLGGLGAFVPKGARQ